MRDTLIGLQDNDMAWWDGAGWTPNIFCADKFESNEAVLMVHRMKEQKVDAYTEHECVAAKRFHRLTQEAG